MTTSERLTHSEHMSAVGVLFTMLVFSINQFDGITKIGMGIFTSCLLLWVVFGTEVKASRHSEVRLVVVDE